MCVAVPGRILSVREDALAEVDFGGVRREISLAFLEDPRPGEYVIVHAGFALHKVAAAEAEETLALMRDALGDVP